MQVSRPLVSIIMPSYNDQRYIASTLQSVLSQSFADFELLAVDDGSSDLTCDIVESFSDPRIVRLSTPGRAGPATARNLGTDAARGRLIALLDSDDLWPSSKLERQVEFMRAGGIAFSYTLYDLMNEDGVKFATCGAIPSIATYRTLMPHCFVRTSTVMYDTQLTAGKAYFPPLRKRQDFGLFLALLKRVPQAHLLAENLCSYRIRRNSVSSNKWNNISYQWAVYRSVEQLPLPQATFYLGAWFMKSGALGLRRKWARSVGPRRAS